MDEIDHKILSLIQKDGRITNKELSDTLGMAPSGVLERVRKLEKKKVIEGYTARIKPEKVGLRLLAFIFIKSSDRACALETADELAAMEEVLEVHHIAGEDCYLIKVRAANTQCLAEFMRERLSPIKTIVSTRTMIVFESIKEISHLKIPEYDEGDIIS